MNHNQDDVTGKAQRVHAVATAKLLSGAKGSSVVEMLQKLGFLDVLAEDREPMSSRIPGSVGIWEPVSRDGMVHYERSLKRSSEWCSWANVKRITPKGKKKRVVLVGESVARGFFYDPVYTPARVLAHMLGVTNVPTGVEVVDLAKNNLLFDQLLDLIRSATVLDPDVYVIFAGNNVFPRLAPHNRHIRNLLAVILRERGMPGLKRYYEEQATGMANDLVSGLSRIGIPVVFIIPESNLTEWHLEEAADAPWISQGGNEQWFRCFAEAKEALRRGDLQAAEARAEEMVALDRGTAASGLRTLASCRHRQDAIKESRLLYERARDSHIWDLLLESPRPLASVQETLRKELLYHGIPLVDLPRVFEERAAGRLPDRELFLDYCHLTADGIRIAMGATALHVAEALGGEATFLDELVSSTPLPADEVEAEARFAAAIHCAHFGQPYDIVHHNCSKALAASSGRLSQVMVAYMEVATRRAPSWMCAAAERIAQTQTACLDRYLRGTGELKLIDRVLFDALADVLESTGSDVREWLQDLRCREHGITRGRRVNLLDRYYAPSWRHRDWAAWIWDKRRRHHYYQASEVVSNFHFVYDSDDPIALRLTCRLVDSADPSKPCIVSVNGTELERLLLAATWNTWTITVPHHCLKRGMNCLEIRWGMNALRSDSGIERAAQDLEQGLEPRLVPALAAIHALTATVADETAVDAKMRGATKR